MLLSMSLVPVISIIILIHVFLNGELRPYSEKSKRLPYKIERNILSNI